MACEGSGVQIPSAPPQINGPLRRRPPANPGARAATSQHRVRAGGCGGVGGALSEIVDGIHSGRQTSDESSVGTHRGGRVAAPRTETAIARIRDLILSGRLPAGSRLPPEHELAAQLGLSRNTAREAVRALTTARVLDVRRG